MADQITDSNLINGDNENDPGLRPSRLDDFIGQKELIRKLRIYLKAAKMRGEPVDHTLLYGPPGLGKTTLAHIIAHEMGVNIKVSSGPVLTKTGDLAAILTNLEKDDVLFLDEIHRLNRSVEEVLYSAMEDFELDIIIGKGPGARNIRIPVQPFTLIGATTRAGLLTSPLRDRFGVMEHLEFYDQEEINTVISRSASILGVRIDSESSHEIARRSRYTPRVANRLLKRIRDFAEVKNNGVIDASVLEEAFGLLHIDSHGLEKMDRMILSVIIERFGGGPVGLETLSAIIGEERDTIEDMYEPFLIRSGYLERTPRGRAVSSSAYGLLGIDRADDGTESGYDG